MGSGGWIGWVWVLVEGLRRETGEGREVAVLYSLESEGETARGSFGGFCWLLYRGFWAERLCLFGILDRDGWL